MSVQREPDHSIIENPWQYQIIEFHYHVEPDNGEGSFIDLYLKKDDVVRRLRFLKPQNLQIEKGFPYPTGGLCILDIRSRQLDGLGVEVADFENSNGAITFHAWNVIDLDKQS
jgi:hypothetical protein